MLSVRDSTAFCCTGLYRDMLGHAISCGLFCHAVPCHAPCSTLPLQCTKSHRELQGSGTPAEQRQRLIAQLVQEESAAQAALEALKQVGGAVTL